MHSQKEIIQNFFGARFAFLDPVHEMRFEAAGIRYRLWLDEERQLLLLTGDAHNPDNGFPAIEIGFRCESIDETVANGVGPVLLFYASPDKSREHLRLCITRTGDGRFSISPNLR